MVGAALALAAVARRGRRVLTALPAVLVLGAVLLLAGGAGAALLHPAHWGRLLVGLGDGAAALPQATLPLAADADPWLATVVLASGGLLLGATVLLAVRLPARPALGARLRAAAPAVVASGVPGFILMATAPALTGAALFAALAAALWLEAVPARGRRVALGLAAGAALAGVAGGALLDRDRPWLD